jgi:hypothetical protein
MQRLTENIGSWIAVIVVWFAVAALALSIAAALLVEAG